MRQPLGQHFLKNKKILDFLAKNINIETNDMIIEIGPGHGELTEKLREIAIKKSAKLILIEKDKKFAEDLQKKFKNEKNINVINGDVLKKLPILILKENLATKNYKLVGNIPYYITGKLFRVISELNPIPCFVIFMIQKEVAKRICSAPPKMNILAASVQFWGDPKIILNVPRSNFSPMPKVDSAIIKIETQKNDKRDVSPENYYKTIHVLFKQPRKTLLNNIYKSSVGEKIKKDEISTICNSIQIDCNKRAQDLSVKNIKKLAQMLYN